MEHKRRRRTGFTLMEIMLVLAILVVLASASGIGYMSMRKSAFSRAATSQVANLKNMVNGSNYCQIGLDYDEARGRIVVFSVLDSIGKGGAQVGVENMNLLFGLERTAGLGRRGLHPH